MARHIREMEDELRREREVQDYAEKERQRQSMSRDDRESSKIVYRDGKYVIDRDPKEKMKKQEQQVKASIGGREKQEQVLEKERERQGLSVERREWERKPEEDRAKAAASYARDEKLVKRGKSTKGYWQEALRRAEEKKAAKGRERGRESGFEKSGQERNQGSSERER